jgi:hypothetical protein
MLRRKLSYDGSEDLGMRRYGIVIVQYHVTLPTLHTGSVIVFTFSLVPQGEDAQNKCPGHTAIYVSPSIPANFHIHYSSVDYV